MLRTINQHKLVLIDQVTLRTISTIVWTMKSALCSLKRKKLLTNENASARRESIRLPGQSEGFSGEQLKPTFS